MWVYCDGFTVVGLLWWVYCDGFTVVGEMAGGRDVGLL